MKFRSEIKGRIGFILAFLLMVNLLSPISLSSRNYVNATSSSSSVDSFSLTLPQGTQLSKWVLDESSGFIYALSNNQMFMIRTSDLTLQNTVDVGSGPSDLVFDDENIYIGFYGAHQFKTVNKLSGQITDTFTTGRTVDRLDTMGDYIYYYSYDSYLVYRYNLVTKNQEELPLPAGVTRISLTDLDINEEYNLLYLAGGNTFYVLDLNNTTNIVSTMEMGGYNFRGPVITEGEDVFFAARKFRADDLNVVKGLYSSYNEYHVDQISQVRERYVITSRHIFDKETYRILYSYSSEQSLVALDADNNLYTASYSEITKKKIDLPNLSYGDHITLDNKVKLRAPIVDQVFDDEYIYAITEDNTLVKINKNSLKVEAEVYVGSKPVNIFMQGESLYIATQGASSISVIPDATAEDLIVEQIQLPGVVPFGVAVYENYMFVSTANLSRSAEGTLSYSFITKDFHKLKQGVFDVNSQQIRVAPALGKVYAGGFNVSEVYDISGESPNHIISRHYLSYNIGNMHIDGTSLYGGTKKYDLSDGFSLQATFPEMIIYAKENHAFSSKSVYNSTSTVKQFDLPFEAGMIEFDESGAVYIGRLDGTYSNSEVKQIYKFDSMQEIVEYTNKFTPQNAMLLDFDYTEGLVNGVVIFEPAEKDEEVAFYELVYLDDQLNERGFIGRVNKTDRLEDIYYKELNFYIQSTQKYIAVYGFTPLTNSGNTYRKSKYALTRIWDAPAYLAQNISFTDNDSHLDQIGGTLSWQHSGSYKADDVYEVYFAGKDGLIGEPLAANSVKNTIQVQIPSGTSIPDKALMLAVVFKDPLVGFAPSYMVTPILDRMTRTLSENDVQIDNKTGNQNDVITVRNLKQGETIHLYDEDQVWVKSETVVAGSSTVSMKVTHLDDHGGLVYLSVQAEGKAEGLIITKTYGQSQTSSPPPSGGGGVIPPPSGGGGVITPPSGGGGVVPPPSGGGGVMPSPSANPTQEQGNNTLAIDMQVNSHKDSAGRVKVVAQIGSMKKYFEANQNVNVIEIQAVTDEVYNSLQYEFQYTDLADVQKELNGKELELTGSFGRLRVGADDLLQGVSPGSIIRITIEDASGQVTETRSDTTKSWSMVSAPVEYKVEVITDNKIREIQPKDVYWGHLLHMDSSEVNPSKLAGVVFDPSTKSWLPVPSTFANQNGQITGTLWRKGNSTYAIVQNEINFSDLPTSKEARESIEKLATRLIINGYADGTFRPKGAVTRSEFATLLVKSLGILPEGETTAKFSDVTTDSWFYTAASSAAQAKLIHGYGNGTFRPQQKITHAEMIKMLGNALAYIQGNQQRSETQKIQIMDQLKMETEAPEWLEEALISIAEKGVVGSRDHVIHSLNALTTREESAIYIYRLLKAVVFID